jgi:hypothetical protein
MKRGPMTLADIETVLIEAARLSNHRNFVIAGSLSVLGAVMQPPDDMLMSRDIDLYTKLDPARVFVEIAAHIGEGSNFHATHGYYADPISPVILSLPDGWESRLIPVTLAKGIVANFIEPDDVTIAKLARSEDNDVCWVTAGARAGIIRLDVAEARLGDTHHILKGELKKIRASLKAIRRNITVG